MIERTTTQERILNKISRVLKEGGKTYEMLPKIREALKEDETMSETDKMKSELTQGIIQ